MFIDSHCHLDFSDFAEDGLENIVQRADAVNVKQMVTICTRISKFPQIRAIAEQFDNIYCTIGTHPHSAGDDEEQEFTTEYLVTAANDYDKIVGIGETGQYCCGLPRQRLHRKRFRQEMRSRVWCRFSRG